MGGLARSGGSGSPRWKRGKVSPNKSGDKALAGMGGKPEEGLEGEKEGELCVRQRLTQRYSSFWGIEEVSGHIWGTSHLPRNNGGWEHHLL